MQIRQHMRVYGSVQGVGFRYRAKHMADALSLTGVVHNLPDGSVELEVQGEEGIIEEYVDRLCNSSYLSVSHIEQKKCGLVEECAFRILDYY